jgi:formylglycine-generating enzyme required for sulfatase activity
MRYSCARFGFVVSLLVASAASAVTMDWTPIGNPGNSCDVQPDGIGGTGCYGAVSYGYRIGTYEVTNAQYAEFLNAKAASDPLALYNTVMASGVGGITRSGSDGSYTYSAITGRENMPVNYVNFYDSMRFANWMNNGQANGSTETGAYTLLGERNFPINGEVATRNAGAAIVLATENEWYKAAYYDPSTASYFDYPAHSNTQTACAAPAATGNTANCSLAVGDLTAVGSYTGSASPYGTFDLGGNVREWSETIVSLGPLDRVARGGQYASDAGYLAASSRGLQFPSVKDPVIGIRLVLLPEPSTGMLVIAGLLGLAGWRRASA